MALQQQAREVSAPTGTCSVTGRTLAEGEEFYSVLFEDGASFRRVDFSIEAWTGPPDGAYCVFKTSVPRKQAARKQLFVNDELLIDFFKRLEKDAEPLRIQFRFVLAMILMRKRLLKYVDTVHEKQQEVWRLKLGKEEALHSVINPRIADAEIEAVSRELTAILSGDVQQLVQELEEREADAAGDAATPES